MSALRLFLVAIPVTTILAGCGSGSTASTSSSVTSSAGQSAATTTAASSQTGTSTSAPAQSTKSTGSTTTAAVPSGSAGPSASPPAAHKPKPEEQLGKTPFLAATGQAFAAFQEDVAKPFRQHLLINSASGQVTMAKAALAATYSARELESAVTGAAASSSLSPLVGPLTALRHDLASIGASLRAGHLDAKTINAARKAVISISLKALEAGQPIQEVAPKLP